MAGKTLLIVWVYFPAVGHLVEAIELAANYHKAHPDLKIQVLVHHKTPCSIGGYCDFIEAMHPIDDGNYLDAQGGLQALIPDTFDYVVFPKRLFYTPQDFTPSLLSCNRFLQGHFKAKLWSGYNDIPDSHPNALKALPHSAFKIQIPKEKISFKLPEPVGYPVIAVMLKGASKQSIWPSMRTWKRVFKSIKQVYPDALFLITGLSSAHSTIHLSIAEAKAQITQFVDSVPGAINAYDVGLDNQLGLIQQADVFLSPHTGFAFLAPCLGTPWLALSGGEWAEHMAARQPFYAVLPNCPKYPCNNGDKLWQCKLRIKAKQPIRCMSALDTKLDEVLVGLKKLLDPNYSFEASFKDYEHSALNNGVHLKKLWRLTDYKNISNEEII